MKPKVFFKCENYNCEQYNKEIKVKKIDTYFIEEYCSSCHKKGKLRFSHKGIESNSSEAFYQIVIQMGKEYRLLKRMIEKGVAEEEDKVRAEKISDQISGLECTGCGQEILTHEH